MIKSIRMLSSEEVDKTKTDEWNDCGLGGYEFDLPSLKGKTIEFKPGVNVIVGRNGCGKTSLLNVIRKLTMCDRAFSSHYSRGHGEARLHRMQNFGYFRRADISMDCRFSVFNLRKPGDMESYDWESSAANFSQFFNAKRRSDGQNVNATLKMMMVFFMFGEDHYKDSDVEKGKEGRNFEKCVIEHIRKAAKTCKAHQFMLDYYERNGFKAAKGDPYWGWTMLFDEPDKGLDVFNVKELFDFITNEKDEKFLQKIVVLHNIGLIHKLKEWGHANFIDLDKGYLEEVEKFFK